METKCVLCIVFNSKFVDFHFNAKVLFIFILSIQELFSIFVDNNILLHNVQVASVTYLEMSHS